MSTDAIAAFVERNAVDIDTALNSVIDRVDPARLYEPSKYILEGKGKRFRPQLVLAAAEIAYVAMTPINSVRVKPERPARGGLEEREVMIYRLTLAV